MRGAWWWIDRWRKSTAYTDMTLEEQGAYRNLLDELWLRDGLLPNDDRILAKICGDALAWPKVRAAVLARFTITTDGLRNETHDEVSAQSRRRADKQRSYRNKGGNAAGNAGGNKPGNAAGNVVTQPVTQAVTNPVLRSPSPSPSPISEEKISRPQKNGRGKVTWLTPFFDIWRERYGGELDAGPTAKRLKPRVDELGADEVIDRFRRYCARTSGEYVSVKRFCETIGEWTADGPRAVGHSTAHENQATVRRFLAENT